MSSSFVVSLRLFPPAILRRLADDLRNEVSITLAPVAPGQARVEVTPLGKFSSSELAVAMVKRELTRSTLSHWVLRRGAGNSDAAVPPIHLDSVITLQIRRRRQQCEIVVALPCEHTPWTVFLALLANLRGALVTIESTCPVDRYVALLELPPETSTALIVEQLTNHACTVAPT